MRRGCGMAMVGVALLALAACAVPTGGTVSDRGAQAASSQTGLTVSGSARIGVTRTIN
ncbi:MAG: hypothetical protein LPK16_15100 [Rhodobacterales bacterium]|nr:hypothetical protein [Rhodobacterales bacterium]MDX5391671.1 hypothetical protein [Rhodobacterales bacterium]